MRLYFALTCTNHQFDVLTEVPSSIYPHDSDHLPQSDPENSKSGSVSVHQVEDVLTVRGHTGQSQQKTDQTADGRHLHFVIPQGRKSVVKSSENRLQGGEL